MKEYSVVSIYETMTEAEDAIRQLDEGGFPIKQVSLVAQNLQSEREVHGFLTTGDVALDGATAGAWVGGLFGLLIGAAFIWVPGFGSLLIAGPLAAALLGGLEGALAGAASGGLLGALVGWGISQENIIKYEQKLKGGKYLIIATGTPDEVFQARKILETTQPEELDYYLEAEPSA
jgi:uncharacterized membrane protein